MFHILADVAATPTASLTQFLEDVGAIIDAATGWMTQAFTTISGNAVLMAIVFGLPLVGLGISLLGRLIRV